MIIAISVSALEHLHRIMQTDPSALGVLVTITPTGCAGSKYNFELVHQLTPDIIPADSTNTLYIKITDLNKLQNSTLTIIQSGLQRVLQLDNPNELDRCGCGLSIRFKDPL